jgi:hypothetical protein
LVPAETTPPATLAGVAVTTTARRGGQTWVVSPPALLTVPVVAELVAVLGKGAAAVVLLGPVPSRELQTVLAELENVPLRSLPRARCVLADGGHEVRRGDVERVDLRLALPGPEDPRLALAPALELWLEHSLAPSFPGVRVSSDLGGGCPTLAVRAPCGELSPVATLKRLRQELARLAEAAPTPVDLDLLTVAWQGRLALLATNGAEVATQLVDRLALGVNVAQLVAAPRLDPAALTALTRVVLGGHAGFATLIEQETRSRPPAVTALPNGATVTTAWIPGQLAVVALALGSLDPLTARSVLDGVASAAARRGWGVSQRELLGVASVAVAAPSSSVTEVLESMLVDLDKARGLSGDPLVAEVQRSLGVATTLSGDGVSVALALPPEAEEGVDAARKFLDDLPPGGVRVDNGLQARRLAWQESDETPRVVAALELPPGAVGAVLAGLLRERAARESALQCQLIAPPGRLLLLLLGSGEAHVPALDVRLAASWSSVRGARVSTEEVTASVRRLQGELFGDLATATARTAAQPFVAGMPSLQELLGVSSGDVTTALAGLPAWNALPRFARGRAPQVVMPSPGGSGVRKSPTPVATPPAGGAEGR